MEREIKTVLTLEDASFSKGLKAATSNVSAIRAEMQAAVAGAGGLGKGMKQWKAQVTGLSSALKSQKQQMSLLNRQYTEQKKKLTDAEKALKEAKKAHGENSEEVKKAANAYAYESTQVDELRIKMARLSTQMSQDKAMLNQRLTQPLKMAASAAKTFGIVVGTSMLAAGTALVALGKKSLDARQQLNADLSASQATFEVWSNFVEKDAKNAWQNLGLSTDAYLQHAVSMGEYLQAAGLPVQQSAALTSELMQRAADLAGVYGTSTDDALGAIEKAAQGSYREMKRYGLSLNSASVEQWALDKGLIQVGESLSTEQERAYAVQMILDKTSSAAGGFATRTDNVNAALETASAAWQNFIDGTGSADSVVAAFSQAAGAVAKEVENLTPELVAGIKALILAFVDNLPGLLTELTPALNTLLGGILSTLTDNSEAIGEAAGTLVGTLAGSLIANLPELVAAAGKMIAGFLRGFLNAARSKWKTEIWPALQKVLKITFGIDLPDWETIKTALENGWNSIKKFVGNLFKAVFTLDYPSWEQVDKDIRTGWAAYRGGINQLFRVAFGVDMPKWEDIGGMIDTGWDSIWGDLSTLFEAVFGVKMPSWKKIKGTISMGWQTVSGTWGNMFHAVFGVDVPDAWEAVKGSISTGWGTISSGVEELISTVFRVGMPSWEGVKTDIETGRASIWDSISGLFSTVFDIHFPTFDEISDEWNTFWGNLYNNLPGWLKDVLSFFGIGGGEAQSGETALNAAANSLADTVNSASSSISSLSGAAASAAEHIASSFVGESGTSHAGVGGRFAGGAWNVPFNNYIAQLHAGEMVLTADQARRYRAQAAAGNTYNDSASIYIDKYNQYSGADADALLAQMQAMQRRRRMGYGLA